MKILIPTDFSDMAKVAAIYACRMAAQIKAEVVILNVVYMNTSGAQASLKLDKIIDLMTENSHQDIALLVKELTQLMGNQLKISSQVIVGSPMHEVVESYAIQNNVDFIVMGTHGATGLKKVLIGSNTNAVISHSTVPVIAVPEQAQYRNIQNMVYASDMMSLDKETGKLIHYARLFNSFLHILHIVPPGEQDKIDRENTKNELINKFQYPKFSIELIESNEIKHAIDKYITQVGGDMLVMFTHKPTFFEKLFGRSVTREMAFHSYVPLLSIKKT